MINIIHNNNELDKLLIYLKIGMPFSESPIIPGESFCDRSVMSPDIVHIPDTTKHPTYSKSRLVTGIPHIIFYFSTGLVLDQQVECYLFKRRGY